MKRKTKRDTTPVGAVIQISPQDKTALRESELALDVLHAAMGTLLVNFETQKNDLLKQRTDKLEEYHQQIVKIATRNGVNLSPTSKQTWQLDTKTHELRRTA